jgi:hypothetical protein
VRRQGRGRGGVGGGLASKDDIVVPA